MAVVVPGVFIHAAPRQGRSGPWDDPVRRSCWRPCSSSIIDDQGRPEANP